ncbi:RNF180 [Bugula neritina]|uniref:RNF180 n=1 Tax=Bugula neritina TaxID=10212 RepID=A0A7J7JQP2_BUGNE|nr:RNF180 [Bugula neritina]
MSSTNSSTELPHQQKHLTKHKRQLHKRTVSEICKSLHKEWWVCSICLELMYRPHVVKPCQHIFCERCLQDLATANPLRTSCPLCRSSIEECQLCSDVDKQIKSQFPNEYRKFAEGKQRAGPLPGHSSRRHLGIFDWIRFTTGNREYRHVVICSFYLGHYIILASRYMSDYIPEVPIPNDYKLDNVPLIVIGFISTLILILR